ncbi:tetratricopeptide repeat protein [Granulicella cerasi]|uniref:Tetratricopeptide repeat protein n=1 Tax=Granulicella cerasi TaxID=741063 RepID=A0ABW1Z9S7_9BACT|nr:hypothetical protein [Granulicella cerasi]
MLPNAPGAIVIETSGGWVIDHATLTNKGKRPVVQLHHEKLGFEVSYILDHDPPYYETDEACLRDTLRGLEKGKLSTWSMSARKTATHPLDNGGSIPVISYRIDAIEGKPVDQQNVFGFRAEDHTCATIHISRANFTVADQPVLDALLSNFRFEPKYVATEEDRQQMAKLLPPAMARLYDKGLSEAADAGPVPARQDSRQSLTFSLASHPGYLHLDAPNFVISELSAKPNGKEFGIRAEDKTLSHAGFLGFLFLPEPAQPNAEACREWMLRHEGKGGMKSKVLSRSTIKSDSGVEIAMVDLRDDKAGAFAYQRRGFIAQGQLCADLVLFAANETMLQSDQSLFTSATFHPDQKPDFFAKMRYAKVLSDHHADVAAAPVYEDAIKDADQTPEPLKWRRVAADQASMAYGMAGDLKHSRAINEAAIAKDPDYPLYYYNLACADAEAGDAKAAQSHLKQAFNRRANVIPGETLPDPRTDDSILKLKGNQEFWQFVQSLPKS